METESQRIQMEIESRRDVLERDLDLLQFKVRQTTDWRAHYQKHTWAALGIAAGVGMLLSLATGSRGHSGKTAV